MRYIVGLIPKTSLPYIRVAGKLFSEVSDGYLLSEKTHPHITLTQFESDDAKLIQILWNAITQFKVHGFRPKLIGMGFIKGLNEHKNFHWAQILVERDPIIMELHLQLLSLLKKYNLNSLIDSGDIYKPHLTLARINLLKPIPLWEPNILETSLFNLTLGESDHNGRYLKTLYG